MRAGLAWQLGANLLALAIFVAAWFTSREFPDKTRLFPSFVILAGLALVLVRLVQEALARNAGEDAGGHSGMDLRADDQLGVGEALAKASGQFAWIVGVVGAAALFGPLLVLPIFILCHMRFSGRESWATAIGSAIGFAVFLVFVFEALLNTFWPEGLISWPQDTLLRAIEQLVDSLV